MALVTAIRELRRPQKEEAPLFERGFFIAFVFG